MDQNFVKSTLSLLGEEKGKAWLSKIPELIKIYEKKWNLISQGYFENLSINYVEKVRTADGKDAVLKIGVPSDNEFLREVETLKLFNGKGSIKLLEVDIDDFAMILERCIPGKPLSELNNEEEEIKIFADVCNKLWIAATPEMKQDKASDEIKYFDWYFENIENTANLIPIDLVQKAKEVFEDLIASQGKLCLLHSDLHHDNILSSERGWLSIDPKGVIGEREYESAVYIHNPHSRFKENDNLIDVDFFNRRIQLLAKYLDLDKRRIAQWAFVKQTISLIWTAMDHKTKDETWLKISRVLEKLI